MWTFCCALIAMLLLLLEGIENSFAQTACGHPQVASHRIIGGSKAKEGAWPWQVRLQKDRAHICGGSLISNQWVVTAAHCFEGPLNPTEYKVNLGEYDLSKPACGMISASISQIIVHPYYAGVGSGADIALMKLKEPVKFSRTILPICLPNASDPDPFLPGMTCLATSWGSLIKHGLIARILQEVDLQIIDTEECNKRYQNEGNTPAMPKNYTLIYKDMICAISPEGKEQTCQGDFGAPLACKLNNTWFLAGVTSYRPECLNPNQPTVYTRTSSFVDWIQVTVAQNAAPWIHTNYVAFLLLPILLILSNTS